MVWFWRYHETPGIYSSVELCKERNNVMPQMSSADVSQALAALINNLEMDDDGDCSDLYHAHARAFTDDGMLTDDDGFTIKLPNGSEFQVTVIMSRRSKDGPARL
jgi:hypothetical protein